MKTMKTLFLGALAMAMVLSAVATAGVFGAGKKGAKGAAAAPVPEADYSRVLGVTHAAGYYGFDPSVSFLEEGAQVLDEMGVKVVKLWLTGSATTNYPYNADWSKFTVLNAVDLLKTDYYRNVLAMDFQTYIFEFHEFDLASGAQTVSWENGMSAAEKQAVEDLSYDVAKYLMTTYVGSGKNFVLQNWEGDNMVATNLSAYDEAKWNGFRDWIIARQ
ncbi:MAG: hypothetical protein LBL66_10590, partial [Clostridiales bacterium]|nr:hypothetical protein [Clostridiales bacterium]